MRSTSRAKVILQPAGGPEAADHYSSTITDLVRLSSVRFCNQEHWVESCPSEMR